VGQREAEEGEGEDRREGRNKDKGQAE